MTEREHTGIEAAGLAGRHVVDQPCWRSMVPEALLGLLAASRQMLAIKRTGSLDYVFVSDDLAALLGASPQSVLGRSDVDLLDAVESAPLRACDIAASIASGPQPSEHRFDRRGTRRSFTVWRMLAPSPDVEAPALLFSLWIEKPAGDRSEADWKALLGRLDAAQREAAEAGRAARDRSLRDEATGLYRHEHFMDQFRRELDLSSREHREFSVVSIAIDPPEPSFADTWADTLDGALEDVTAPAPLSASREARLRVLETLGRLLRENTRAMDASCRVDEEHFTVLLSGVGLATGHARMDGLRRECAAQIVAIDGGELRFTVSMGIAAFPHTATEQDELVFAADRALISALARGNHVCLASITLERERDR